MKFEGEFELFVMDMQNLDQVVKIRKDLPIDLRMESIETLMEYKDIRSTNGLLQT